MIQMRGQVAATVIVMEVVTDLVQVLAQAQVQDLVRDREDLRVARHALVVVLDHVEVLVQGQVQVVLVALLVQAAVLVAVKKYVEINAQVHVN